MKLPIAILTAVGLICGLAACSNQQVAQTTTILGDINSAAAGAQTAVNTATTLYGIAKGMAQVAAAADPKMAPSIASDIAVADAVVDQAPAVVNAAASDIQTATALAATITAQANALTVKAAPKITVVASK